MSVFLEYRASAETYQCSPRGVCVPDVPPVCEPLDCDVSRPQSLFFLFEADKLSTVARVSTVDLLRTIERSPDTDVYRNEKRSNPNVS